MKLSKIKTDKSDAEMICAYARNVKLRLWVGQSKDQQECLQMTHLLSIYTKQSTALKNKLHREEVLGTPSIVVVRSIKRRL
ncbi:MAG: transposase [Patiriisocius sp.]|jgi:transposase